MKFNEKLLKEAYFPQALIKIKEIVKIQSYAQPATAIAPYGPSVKAVLDYAINLSQELGFKTYRHKNNKYGYLEYGEGKEIFAMLGHLDVVPPGNLEEWKIPPFSPEIINGILYGRGVLDDIKAQQLLSYTV